MELIKQFGKTLGQVLESLSSFTQFCLAGIMGLLAHLDVVASVVALLVLLFQFKVVYYNGKLKKIEYNKEKKEALE